MMLLQEPGVGGCLSFNLTPPLPSPVSTFNSEPPGPSHPASCHGYTLVPRRPSFLVVAGLEPCPSGDIVR